jgi:hypothetical protein
MRQSTAPARRWQGQGYTYYVLIRRYSFFIKCLTKLVTRARMEVVNNPILTIEGRFIPLQSVIRGGRTELRFGRAVFLASREAALFAPAHRWQNRGDSPIDGSRQSFLL